MDLSILKKKWQSLGLGHRLGCPDSRCRFSPAYGGMQHMAAHGRVHPASSCRHSLCPPTFKHGLCTHPSPSTSLLCLHPLITPAAGTAPVPSSPVGRSLFTYRNMTHKCYTHWEHQ